MNEPIPYRPLSRPAHLFFKDGIWRFNLHPGLMYAGEMWRDTTIKCLEWCVVRDKTPALLKDRNRCGT